MVGKRLQYEREIDCISSPVDAILKGCVGKNDLFSWGVFFFLYYITVIYYIQLSCTCHMAIVQQKSGDFQVTAHQWGFELSYGS